MIKDSSARVDSSLRTHYTKRLAVYLFHQHYWQQLQQVNQCSQFSKGMANFQLLLQIASLACIARLQRIPSEFELIGEWRLQSLCDGQGRFQNKLYMKGLSSKQLYERLLHLINGQATHLILTYYQNRFTPAHRNWLLKQVQATLRCSRYHDYEWQCLKDVFHLSTSVLAGFVNPQQLLQRVRTACQQSKGFSYSKGCIVQ